MVIDSVVIQKLKQEMELKIDAFLQFLKESTSIWLLGDDCYYLTDISSRNGLNRYTCDKYVCYWYILKACSSTPYIGSG